LEWQQGQSRHATAMWLPFWKISTGIPELSISTFADYVRVASQPLPGGRPKKEELMSFIIPAFKVRPKVFLQTATRMTLSIDSDQKTSQKQRYKTQPHMGKGAPRRIASG
jgi:hypothetical protein